MATETAAVTLPCALVLLLASPTSSQATPSSGEKKAEVPRRYLDVASVRYAFFGRLELPADDGREATTLASQMVRVKIQAGHYFKRTGTVIAGAVGYDLLQSGSYTASTDTSRRSFHHLSVRMALAQRVHRKWMLTAFGKPGIASDYRGFHNRDIQLSAGAAARFAYRPDLVFVFGALYNNGVFGHLVLPVLHIRYRWRALRVHFLFPHKVALWLVPLRKWELGLVGRFAAGVFGIHDGASQRAVGDRLSTLFVTVGLAARSFLIRGWYLSVDGGYLVRYFQIFRHGRQTHGRLDFKGGYLSVAMGYLI